MKAAILALILAASGCVNHARQIQCSNNEDDYVLYKQQSAIGAETNYQISRAIVASRYLTRYCGWVAYKAAYDHNGVPLIHPPR